MALFVQMLWFLSVLICMASNVYLHIMYVCVLIGSAAPLQAQPQHRQDLRKWFFQSLLFRANGIGNPWQIQILMLLNPYGSHDVKLVFFSFFFFSSYVKGIDGILGCRTQVSIFQKQKKWWNRLSLVPCYLIYVKYFPFRVQENLSF